MRTTRPRSTDPANTASPVPGPLGSPLAGEGPAALDLRSTGDGPAPLDGTGDDSAAYGSPATGNGAAPRPANRAERRAARRGRAPETGDGPAVPRNAGPAPHAKPVHVRTDFAARRSG